MKAVRRYPHRPLHPGPHQPRKPRHSLRPNRGIRPGPEQRYRRLPAAMRALPQAGFQARSQHRRPRAPLVPIPVEQTGCVPARPCHLALKASLQRNREPRRNRPHLRRPRPQGQQSGRAQCRRHLAHHLGRCPLRADWRSTDDLRWTDDSAGPPPELRRRAPTGRSVMPARSRQFAAGRSRVRPQSGTPACAGSSSGRPTNATFYRPAGPRTIPGPGLTPRPWNEPPLSARPRAPGGSGPGGLESCPQVLVESAPRHPPRV